MKRHFVFLFLCTIASFCFGKDLPLTVHSVIGKALVNGTTINDGFQFEEGIVVAVGKNSKVIVNYFDGDALTLTNGVAKLQFSQNHSKDNLESRLVTLQQGTIQFILQPRLKPSDVSYHLRVGSTEVYFKDADLEASFDNGGNISVKRGEVNILTERHLNRSSPMVVEAGNTVQLP